MKRLLFLSLFLSITIPLLAQEKFTDMRQELIRIANKYSPTAKWIYNNVGDYRYERYVDGKTIEHLLEDFATTAHEATHHYNSLIKSKYRAEIGAEILGTEGYYIYPDIELGVEQFEVYNSNELNAYVPDSLQKDIFRYKWYIGQKLFHLIWLTSQKRGIFGILNEFDAYSVGLQCGGELYEYYYKYRADGFENRQEWMTFMGQYGSTRTAYYEFNLFILWYLEYSKEQYPEQYEKIMDNKRLRVAYTLIDQNYKSGVDAFYERIDFLSEKLSDDEISFRFDYVEEEPKFKQLIIETKNRITYSELNEEAFVYTKNCFESEDKTILELFRVKGVTKDNYKDHLE